MSTYGQSWVNVNSASKRVIVKGSNLQDNNVLPSYDSIILFRFIPYMKKVDYMVSKEEIIGLSKEIGVTGIGFASIDRLADLPTGRILDAAEHKSILDIFPKTRTVIILMYRVWDPIFNVVAMGPTWKRKGVPLPEKGSEFYQLYSQVLDGKAWFIAELMIKEGFDSTVSRRFALKPAAIIAGLGVKGKNTVILNPDNGSMVRFTGILTEAEFEPDEPLELNICKDCTQCIKACPTGALKPFEIDIYRCLTYAAENPFSKNVTQDVRQVEEKIIRRPSINSFIECTICLDSCPYNIDLKRVNPEG